MAYDHTGGTILPLRRSGLVFFVYDTDGEGKCDLKLGDTYLLELSSGFFM